MTMKSTVIALLLGLIVLPAVSAQSRVINLPGVSAATPQETAIFKQTCQLRDEAERAMDAGKYEIAEGKSRKSISLGLTGNLCQNILAASLYEQGKDKEAFTAYKMLADEGSEQARDLLPYILLLLKSGQYSQAADAYNKMISHYSPTDMVLIRGSFDPHVPQPTELETACHIELGQVWMWGSLWGANANYVKALDEYQKALQLSPDDALANYYKGDVLKRLGFKAQAHDAYAKAAQFGAGDVRKAAEDALAGRG